MNPSAHRASWRTDKGLYVSFYEAAGRVKPRAMSDEFFAPSCLKVVS
jgi:hypothetical protein